MATMNSLMSITHNRLRLLEYCGNVFLDENECDILLTRVLRASEFLGVR